MLQHTFKHLKLKIKSNQLKTTFFIIKNERRAAKSAHSKHCSYDWSL